MNDVGQKDILAQGRKRGISGSTLKLIAIAAMLTDHIGAVIVWKALIYDYSNELYAFYNLLRGIGRIGFPIFCFLLVEGFCHTGSITKYALRLGLFALISEIPFDLAFFGAPFDWSYQNVFFTLFIGLLVMSAFKMISEKWKGKYKRFLFYILALLLGVALAEWLNTDYAGIGVLCIMALYLFRKNKPCQMVAGCTAFLWEVPAPLAFIPIVFYNGRRGLRIKYLFYAFYPVHLFILYLIAGYAVKF